MTNRANNSPTDIIARYVGRAPVDVEAMADALGLNVSYQPLADNISGKIEHDLWDDEFKITVNSKHHPRRRRFTIAHEIGHYVLHADMIGDGIIDDALYRSHHSDKVERQANVYAASLLMPAPLVRSKFSAGVDTAAEMARLFEVSESMARIRLEELGLVAPAHLAEVPPPVDEQEYLRS